MSNPINFTIVELNERYYNIENFIIDKKKMNLFIYILTKLINQ